jgi:hypothetical protein
MTMSEASRIGFRLAKHAKREVEIVEVLCDGEVCAAIYPAQDSKMLLVSAHIRALMHDDGSAGAPPIPSILVEFNPEPYEISYGRIVKPRRA